MNPFADVYLTQRPHNRTLNNKIAVYFASAFDTDFFNHHLQNCNVK